jgi:hypothetical protein
MLTVEEVIQDPKRFPTMSFEAKTAPKTQEQRKDPMCRVRITSLTDGQVIPGGHVIPAGVHTAVVHEKDLPIIEAMVEPNPELIDVARKAFDRKVRQSVADQLAACIDKDEDGEEVRNVMKRAYEEFPGSVAGMFHQFNDRDILPFSKVEVVERGLVAPASQAVTDMQTMTAKLVADTVAHTSGDTAAIVSGVIEQLVKAGLLKVASEPNQQNQKR